MVKEAKPTSAKKEKTKMIDGTNFLVLAYSDVQNNKTQWN